MPSRTGIPAQERALYSKVRQWLATPGVLRGNLVERRRQCGKPTCGGQRAVARRHRSLYLGVSLEGRRRMIYIPAAWEARGRQWTRRYAAGRAVLEQLSRATLARRERREG